MKKYNLVCTEKFTSKKNVEYLKVCFCDNKGVYTYITDQLDGCSSALVGKPYLTEFGADCYFYFSNGQQRVIITGIEVK